ncbi:TonB-dependent receptor [Salinisphaera sp. PC39]|uniref:TonB-dependent receptor domain-containing protein n=1 Tax=Salinisphaera sp. PC39 TaxID=1304156 RepID=UPI003342D1FF
MPARRCPPLAAIGEIARDVDIESERVTSYEISARLKPASTVDTLLTYFCLDFEDQIAFDATAGRFSELGESLHQGIKAQAQWRLAAINDLSLNASCTYLDTEQRASEFAGNEPPFASEH